MKILSMVNKIYLKLIHPNKVAKKVGVKFGKNCFFNTKLFGSEPNFIKIGDDFYTSANVQFITHDGSINVLRNIYNELKNADSFNPIIIGNNVFIGYGATILPGTIIGNNVIIGAGSIVKGKLNDNSIYAGIPCKYICTIEEYKMKNKDNFLFTKNMVGDRKKEYLNNWLINNYPEFKEL